MPAPPPGGLARVDLLASVITDLSASDVTINNNRSVYDVFGVHYSPSCYLPNKRLRRWIISGNGLSDDFGEVRSLEHVPQLNLISVHTLLGNTLLERE